jgi:coiled-coil and C2 domain-containing protein 2A
LIERCLVTKIEEWRDHRITRWNRLSSRAFKVLIQKFEADVLDGIDISAHTAYRKEISQLRAVYQVNGFPLNLVYTDIDAIIEAVYNTDVHSCADPLVEFSIAVSCTGYPGKFVSVWVYIANLTR